MPKSKSTRGKKYCQKQVFSPFRLRQIDLEKIHDDFRKFEMVVELNAIRDFAAIAGDVIHKSFDLCPRRTIKEYLAMKDLTRNIIGRVRLNEKIVKQAIDRYTNDVRGAMRQSALNPANQEQTA